MQSLQRLKYLDCIKGIAIILVILGHIDIGNNPLCIWIYSFHMPLFFIVSGMLMQNKKTWMKLRIKEHIKRRAIALLYPYFTFSILSLTYRLFLFIIHKEKLENIIQIIKYTFSFQGYYTLWFLPTLFIAEIVFIIIQKKYDGSKYTWIFILVFSTIVAFYQNMDMPIESNFINKLLSYYKIINRALIGSVFIYIGAVAYPYLENVSNKIKKRTFIVISMFAFIINIFVSQYNYWVDLHYSVLNNPLLYYFCAISGSFSMIILIRFVLKSNNALEYLGRNSLIIMATQSPLPVIILATKIVEESNIFLNRYINVILVCGLTIIFEICIIKLIIKFIPFIVKASIKSE